MDDSDLRLDGNAAAGLLRQIFAEDVTAARAECASCGNVATIGETPLYMANPAPGGVLRCRRCEDVLMVVVDRDGGCRLGMPGVRWIELG